MGTLFSEWRDDLRTIRTSLEVAGLEKVFDLIIYLLTKGVITEWLLLTRRWRDYRQIVTESYVCITTLLLACTLGLSHLAPKISVGFATYILISAIIILLNVVFLTKVFGKPISNERTLLLFFLNVVQAVLTFAIWYRFALSMQAREALFNATLVFGTVGYPKKGADIIVTFQIATDFLLIAVFLAFFVGNLGKSSKEGQQ